jgi:aminopeptidase YwaD
MSDVQTMHTGMLSELLDALDITRIERDLQHLASDLFAGRRVGTSGHDLAQAWLTRQMKAIGLDTQLFEFTLTAPVLDIYDLPRLILLDESGTAQRTFQHRVDFAEHPRSADHSISRRGKALDYAKMQSMDAARGAWVVLEMVPQGEALSEFVAQIREHGGIGLLVPQYLNQAGYLAKRIMAGDTVSLPVISVNVNLLTTFAGTIIEAATPVRAIRPKAGHVIGVLNPAQDNTPLIVGAHFDGVGDDPSIRIPCAGDNAAAVAVILEVARVLKVAQLTFSRTIQFMAFDCEEVNAQGSCLYAEHVRQTGISPLVINLDGAASLHERIVVDVGAGAETLVDALDWAGQLLEIPLISDTVSSDNRQFASAGFPAVGIGAGTGTNCIHSPADTPDKVDLQGTLRAARLLLTTITHLAVVS